MSSVTILADPKKVVLPGTRVAILETTSASDAERRPVVRLGAGVVQQGNHLVASKAGFVKHDPRRSKVWIAGNQRRYEPVVGEAVIGIVTDRHAEEYRLDIKATDTATLSALAFEGATKRNKPSLTIGSTVYCRMTLSSKDMECETSCIEPGSSRSWVSGETLYGELKGGNIVNVSLALARRLQAQDSPILSKLGSEIPFESAVGANGRIWIKSGSIRSNVLLCILIGKADEMCLEKWETYVSSVITQFKS